ISFYRGRLAAIERRESALRHDAAFHHPDRINTPLFEQLFMTAATAIVLVGLPVVLAATFHYLLPLLGHASSPSPSALVKCVRRLAAPREAAAKPQSGSVSVRAASFLHAIDTCVAARRPFRMSARRKRGAGGWGLRSRSIWRMAKRSCSGIRFSISGSRR